MSDGPVSVRWTLHALGKAERLGYTREWIEQTVLEDHRKRIRNAGSAGWCLARGRLVVVYEHPDDGDALRARIVTLWRRR